MFNRSFKWVSSVYQRSSKGDSGETQRNVPGKFQESCHGRFECFIDVLYYNFIFAWHSSQLPAQKEGLFKRGNGME